MILIDSRVGSKDLYPIIQRLGRAFRPAVECELTHLQHGDVCFMGLGPQGPMSIGVERKRLHDMLNCVDDARYAAFQRRGMKALYKIHYLMLEGLWACGDGNGYDGLLMQGFRRGQGWGPLKTRGERTVLYSKLSRYMLSMALSGAIIARSLDSTDTAIQIIDMYQYFQKPWNRHTSLLETQKIALPTLDGAPTLCMEWAARLPGVGVERSMDANRLFKTGFSLANSDVEEWITIPGIGKPTANNIVRTIRGFK